MDLDPDMKEVLDHKLEWPIQKHLLSLNKLSSEARYPGDILLQNQLLK